MRFSGSMTALITPFRDGQIDAPALERIVELQIAGGTSALVPCGSTGESATLTHQEHVDLVRMVVKFARGRLPVIAGTGSNSTAEAISLTKAAKEAGADAALLISPYYNKPTQEGIYQHYRAIAEQARFPLIVYNIPGRTASKIEASTIARLAKLDNVIGLKEATGSLDEVQEVIRLCGDSFEVYSGDDALTLPMMAVGGTGVISVTSNLVPDRSAAVTRAALAGNWAEARRLHYDLLALNRALFVETNPIPIKAAMSMAGHCRDELRPPLLPMSDEARARLKVVMQQYGLLKS
ncbi:MAG TPA: 4-hydroxy-tetrahydrodipicolinate synthase [Candidatus Acidoferrales bacterium]|nr:4-hydroxy-tetrahydrodipicolinate synthase [Candidatus Acidoferrales bacterium]